MIAQIIRFEYASTAVVTNRGVLETVKRLAEESPDQDIRVTDDGNNNIKVHVGPYGAEPYRYWVYSNGLVILKEEDTSEGHTQGHWQAVFDEVTPVEELVATEPTA